MGLTVYTIGVMLMTLSVGRMGQLLLQADKKTMKLADIPDANEVDDDEEEPPI